MSGPSFSWYGDMDLAPHLWAALKRGPLDVVVQFHPPLPCLKPTAARRWLPIGETAVRGGLVDVLNGAMASRRPSSRPAVSGPTVRLWSVHDGGQGLPWAKKTAKEAPRFGQSAEPPQTRTAKSQMPDATKKLFIKTYGCQMNVYDSERMTDALSNRWATETERIDPKDADLVAS